MNEVQDKSSKSTQRNRRGHTKPRAPVIGLDQPGRLRVAHLLALFSCSHATLYSRLRDGRYPKQDGYDGRFPYWNCATIKSFLEGKSGTPAVCTQLQS